jgi:putative ABC transport system ATP-binding protein
MGYIEFENVIKTYGQGQGAVNALDGVTFHVNKGEFCILLGESGAGKTTLLNMLGGMDTITSGKITFDGRDVSNLSKGELVEYRRHDVGFVFKFYNLIPNLTALENVEIAAQLCKNPIDAKTALELVDLSDRENNFPAELSGGEQQRVAIARALVNNPSMIIADEPTGNLDPQRSLEIMMLLERINELGTTVLVVTHEKALVNRFAKRVIAIESGKIISDETGGYYNGETN